MLSQRFICEYVGGGFECAAVGKGSLREVFRYLKYYGLELCSVSNDYVESLVCVLPDCSSGVHRIPQPLTDYQFHFVLTQLILKGKKGFIHGLTPSHVVCSASENQSNTDFTACMDKPTTYTNKQHQNKSRCQYLGIPLHQNVLLLFIASVSCIHRSIHLAIPTSHSHPYLKRLPCTLERFRTLFRISALSPRRLLLYRLPSKGFAKGCGRPYMLHSDCERGNGYNIW